MFTQLRRDTTLRHERVTRRTVGHDPPVDSRAPAMPSRSTPRPPGHRRRPARTSAAAPPAPNRRGHPPSSAAPRTHERSPATHYSARHLRGRQPLPWPALRQRLVELAGPVSAAPPESHPAPSRTPESRASCDSGGHRHPAEAVNEARPGAPLPHWTRADLPAMGRSRRLYREPGPDPRAGDGRPRGPRVRRLCPSCASRAPRATARDLPDLVECSMSPGLRLGEPCGLAWMPLTSRPARSRCGPLQYASAVEVSSSGRPGPTPAPARSCCPAGASRCCAAEPDA